MRISVILIYWSDSVQPADIFMLDFSTIRLQTVEDERDSCEILHLVTNHVYKCRIYSFNHESALDHIRYYYQSKYD